MPFKFEKLEVWQKAIGFCDQVLAYEVVNLPVICGKRGLLIRDDYRAFYEEADSLAAMIHGLAGAQTK